MTVRATQAGNASFKPLSVDFTLSSALGSTGVLIYSGTIGNDPFAAVVDVQQSRGTLYVVISDVGEGMIVPFSINPNGIFDATIQSVPVLVNSVNAARPDAPARAAAAERRTFRGTIVNGTLIGTIVELGRSFTAAAQPAAGPTASLAGAYTANTVLSASGTTHLIVNAQGECYAFSISPTSVTAGVGTMSPNGSFAVSTRQAAVIEGKVSPTNKQLTGTVQMANEPAAPILGIGAGTTSTDRIINLSSRVRVGENGSAHSLISGFVVGGTTPKRMLLRAIGPGLAAFGVQDALSNPRLQLYDRTGQVVAQNDDWGNAAAVGTVGDGVGAFRLARDSQDSALLATLPPGSYTMQVESAGGDGNALVEVYDASEDVSAASLINISTRGYIDAGEGAIISGFVISGNTPKRVLVRGVGPALALFGVPGALADPVLRIYQGSVLIGQNDNWETPQPVGATQSAASAADVIAATTRVGGFPMPANSKDAAVVITLAPGLYTATLSGMANTAGSGLLEIYQIPND